MCVWCCQLHSNNKNNLYRYKPMPFFFISSIYYSKHGDFICYFHIYQFFVINGCFSMYAKENVAQILCDSILAILSGFREILGTY